MIQSWRHGCEPPPWAPWRGFSGPNRTHVEVSCLYRAMFYKRLPPCRTLTLCIQVVTDQRLGEHFPDFYYYFVYFIFCVYVFCTLFSCQVIIGDYYGDQ